MRLPSFRPDSRRVGALALGVAAAAAPLPASAQEGCVSGEGTLRYYQEPVPGGGTIGYFSSPHFVCDNDVEIWADSSVTYSQLGMSVLIGSVRYVDRTRELRADSARYFTDQGRLQASGHVFVRDETDGSQIENGDLVYLGQTDFRDVETITVDTGADGVRPRALLPPAAPDGAAPDAERAEPYSVVGDRIFLRGDAYFTASGTVEIVQDSLFAFADSAEYDQEGDALLLEGSARVLSGGSELTGRTITVGSPGADTSEIRARRDAALDGEDVRLRAAQILVFLVDGALERLVATPMAADDPARPDSASAAQAVATLDDAELTADSLEITAPGEVVERVVAVGSARSVSTARDSLNTEIVPEVARSDWLRGQRVVVTFRPAPVSDEEEGGGDGYEIETITASGAASALYRLAPSDSTARVGVDPPALHYVVGDTITLTMADGEVDDMHVVGQTQGVHLEPLVRRQALDTLSDTARAAPGGGAAADTSTARPDTLRRGRRRAPSPPGIESSAERGPRPTPRKEEPWRRE